MTQRIAARNPFLELGRRDSSSIWRIGCSGRVGGEDKEEDEDKEEKEKERTSQKKSSNPNTGGRGKTYDNVFLNLTTRRRVHLDAEKVIIKDHHERVRRRVDLMC